MATSDDMRVFFDCSKSGKITIETNIVGYFSGDMNNFPIYHTYGEVVEIAGKTYIRIISVCEKTDLLWRGVILALIILMIPFLTLTALIDEMLTLGLLSLY